MSNKWRPNISRWQKRIAIVVLWLSVHGFHVLGFGSWNLLVFRSLQANSVATILKDSVDNFPTTLNVPKVPIPTIISSIQESNLDTSPPSANNGRVVVTFPQDYPKKLRESIDLVSFLQEYGLPGFKRSSSDRATCICPFHDDHNPSMSIDGTRRMYKCFSCGAGGDVFTFVRDYGNLQGEQISFQEAVNLVNTRLLSGNYTPATSMVGSTVNNQRPSSTVSQAKKSRILLVNAAAAAFYEKCLVSRPAAGVARTHLRDRSLLPATIKAFGIGYAPDAYFGSRQESQTWGQGSLVEYLTERRFTTADILDAGLATVLKKDLKQNQPEDPNSEMQTSPSSLMDRFRGRLVVPIMDESGSQVLGFGGRILEHSNDNHPRSSSSSSSAFPQPKYLNSPESPVFQKKQILFGQHMATKALRFWNDQDHAPRAVVIVEGYMDAIALWQAGVSEAVASMGTSLTIEQISAAANLAGTKNGRVILCLDNDQAGIAAVERLCRAGILASVGEVLPVEFRVSTLPANIKDPADYVNFHKNVKKLDEKFRKEILDKNSLGWMDWYQGRVISQYNASTPESETNGFASTLDRLGSFLSMIKDGSEKKRRMKGIVDQLVAFIPSETNQKDVSESVRVQLESEIERKSSMTFNKIKSSSVMNPTDFRKRIEKTRKTFSTKMTTSSTGFDPMMDARPNTRVTRGAPHARDSNLMESRRFRIKKAATPKKKPSLTPHFSGFHFESKHDVGWLGETELMGKTSYTAKSKLDSKGKVVYFNSNDYHGSQFVTEEAMSAGYVNEIVPRDPMLLKRGINSMIEVRAEEVLESTEDELLRFLLNFPTTRKSLQSVMDISNMSGSQKRITWTSQGKAWLFDCLMSDDPELKLLGRGNLTSLHASLTSEDGSFFDALPQLEPPTDEAISQTDKFISEDSDFADSNLWPTHEDRFAPTNVDMAEQIITLSPASVESTSRIGDAIGWADTTSPTQLGKLNHLFREFSSQEIDFESLTDEKATLRVQEIFYTVLWSSSILGMTRKLQEMTAVAPKPLPIGTSDNDEGLMIDVMSHHDLPGHDQLETYQSLRAEINDAAEQIRSVSSARRGLTNHLVQKATPDEARLSTKWLKDYKILSAQLTEHMKEIDRWSIPDPEEISDDETYETTLERTFEEWGDLYEDDRLWSPDDIAQAPLPIDDTNDSVAKDNIEESIGAFTERIEDEWGWLEESSLESTESHSKSGPYEFNEQDWDE